jgi:hypothetical protein
LELPLFSTFLSKQFKRISPTEFATPAPADDKCRYAVSNTPLPSDRCSYWGVDIKSNAWSINIGVIADKGVEHGSGNNNTNHPTMCGLAVLQDHQKAWVYHNGSFIAQNEMASSVGDSLLFRFDPTQRLLTVMNSQTRSKTEITDVARGDSQKSLYITLNMLADPSVGSVTQVALRQLTSAERAMLN